MVTSIKASRRKLCKAVPFCAFLFLASPATVQSNTQEPLYRLQSRVELVDVAVSVTDAHGNFLAHLRRENFRVLDERVEQPITHFESVELPVMVTVVLETSPAVYLIHSQHLQAAQALADGLASGDQVALVTYDLEPQMKLPFTADKSTFGAALLRLHFNLGMAQLNLYDSLSKTLDWLGRYPGKKAVVLLSTGLDSFGPGRWEQLKETLRRTDVVIYPVALGGWMRASPKNSARRPGGEFAPLTFEAADRVLNSIAELTGGRAHFPLGPDEFPAIYQQIAHALRHQYRIGFPPAVRDGWFHQIQVLLLDDKGRVIYSSADKGPHRIQARRGYFSPEP